MTLPAAAVPSFPCSRIDPRGGDVERQPEQGREQQDGREGRELQRPLDVHGDQQDDERKGDAEGQQQVQEKGRQRDDHEAQDAHHRDGERDVAVAGDPRQGFRYRCALCDRHVLPSRSDRSGAVPKPEGGLCIFHAACRLPFRHPGGRGACPAAPMWLCRQTGARPCRRRRQPQRLAAAGLSGPTAWAGGGPAPRPALSCRRVSATIFCRGGSEVQRFRGSRLWVHRLLGSRSALHSTVNREPLNPIDCASP